MSLGRRFLFNRGSITQKFSSSVKLCDIQIIFTRKTKTCLTPLKSSFDKNLKSHVVYRITCNGCSSIYFGQTSRHVTTRISENQKKNSPVGQQPIEGCGTAHNIEWEILDACWGNLLCFGSPSLVSINFFWPPAHVLIAYILTFYITIYIL